MNFREYYLSLPSDSRKKLADFCGCSKKHLENVVYGCKRPSRFIAIQVEAFSNGLINRVEVLPERFANCGKSS